jgi:Mn2+/Fe2+ NRAMP family transporter
MNDHYLINDQTIKAPPTSFFQRIRLLGPGFILSASIVGSGELIATTTLGAKAGFTAFWVIIVSCLMKVAVQLEFGKHTIVTGETAMQSFNKLPGLRLGKGSWTIWSILLLMLLKVVQLGGMTGSTAIVLHLLFPSVPIIIWAFASAFTVALLIYSGYYPLVEKMSMFMIAMFTVLTVSAVCFLAYTPYSISWHDITDGLKFKLSAEMVGVAIGAFGITGVASDEIIAYNYWCLEKGYAACTGPQRDDAEWRTRANGWIKVMYLDAIAAMIIYTVVTAAFYLLGAAILHSRGIVPEGNQLIETVALIYTESLGPGVRLIYLIGAFFVLFSSLFASLAAWSRMYPDVFSQLGWMDFRNIKQRKKLIAILAWVLPFIWVLAYLFIELPVVMILFGGIVGSILLFIIVFAAYNFRYKGLQVVKPGIFYDIAFWISIISIVGVGIYGVLTLLN